MLDAPRRDSSSSLLELVFDPAMAGNSQRRYLSALACNLRRLLNLKRMAELLEALPTRNFSAKSKKVATHSEVSAPGRSSQATSCALRR